MDEDRKGRKRREDTMQVKTDTSERIKDMNTVLEAARQMVLLERGEDSGDLYLHTLKTAQIQEEEYFGHLVTNDLKAILRDIREAHRDDTATADDGLSAAAVQERLADAMSPSRKNRQ